jgi:hypothetical protein
MDMKVSGLPRIVVGKVGVRVFNDISIYCSIQGRANCLFTLSMYRIAASLSLCYLDVY